jgi:Raf kinase inhibitor-like YbhB/YbcL family protein
MVEVMNITSPVSKFNAGINTMHTCEGENISPPLTFGEVPQNTKSLLLMLEDPTAESRPWVHWCVFNIPPYTKGFETGMIPEGAIEAVTSTNKYGYDGPCAGSEKEFVFKLYALDSELNLPADSNIKVIMKAMMGHIVEEAQLVVKYFNYQNKPSYF